MAADARDEGGVKGRNNKGLITYDRKISKSGTVEDTITLNGVAEHNPEYTLPDIVAAMQVGNWFDDIADDGESEEIEVIKNRVFSDNLLGLNI